MPCGGELNGEGRSPENSGLSSGAFRQSPASRSFVVLQLATSAQMFEGVEHLGRLLIRPLVDWGVSYEAVPLCSKFLA